MVKGFKFLVSTVGFPLMAGISVIHGAIATGIGFFDALWFLLTKGTAFAIASPTVARKWDAKVSYASSGLPWIPAILYLLALGAACAIPLFVSAQSTSLAGESNGVVHQWLTQHWLIFLGLAATNAYSLVWEWGRAYTGYAKRKLFIQETPAVTAAEVLADPNVPTPAQELMGEITAHDSLRPEDAGNFKRKIQSLVASGRTTTAEEENLWRAVEHREQQYPGELVDEVVLDLDQPASVDEPSWPSIPGHGTHGA